VSEHFEIVRLRNGLNSLRSLDVNETFHPVTGPLFEANHLHVKQQRVRERAEAEGRFILWDVGFGAAANSCATLDALAGVGEGVEIHSFDRTLAPAEFALAHAEELGYLKPYTSQIRELIAGGETRVGNVRWFLHVGDFLETVSAEKVPAPSGIYYDPYSPTQNVEMWTLDHFRRLRARMDPGVPCLLTNYTRSTSVRVTLLLAGFYVGYGWGIGDKGQTTVASNVFSALEHPLEVNWVEKVKISRNSGAMRGQPYPGPILPEDLAALEALEQFQF